MAELITCVSGDALQQVTNKKTKYQCKRCNTHFLYKCGLIKHIPHCSQGVRSIKCPQCLFQTHKTDDLDRHIAQNHM